MDQKKSLLFVSLICAAMLVLILDSGTALEGAKEAINLCIRTVIPSLFPFFVLSILLTSELSGRKMPILRPLGKLCRMKPGTEYLLAIGLLGGYPVGAQCVSQAYRAGCLEKSEAQRLLGFCSNAGPAFLFGITAAVFPNPIAAWVLWFIHICSAIMTAMLLPGKKPERTYTFIASPLSVPQAMEKGIRVMASVCGWITLFRVILSFLSSWFLRMLPNEAQAAICGILELTNGCIALNQIENLGLRFVLCSMLLGFGGLCVLMQTASVTSAAKLSLGFYFPGKVMQASISGLLALAAQFFLFQDGHRISIFPSFPILCAFILPPVIIFLLHTQKTGRIPQMLRV